MPVLNRFAAASLRPLLRLTLTLLITLCLLPSAWAQADGRPVDQVVIDGLAGPAAQQLQSGLRTQAGKPYSAADIRLDLSDLARRMRTATVRTESSPGGGVIVHFVVSEFPHLRRLQVIGNQKLKTARIEGLAKLKEGDPLDENTLRSLKRALINAYQAAGLPGAQVTLQLIDVPAQAGQPAQADLQIVVDEGKQVQVGDVIFTGNQVFSTARLRLLTQTNGSWGGVFKNYFNEETFADDLTRLHDFYVAHGYFDARVERGLFKEVPRADGSALVSPIIQITEGERYKLGEVTVRGVRLFTQAEATAPFTPLQGTDFDGRRFTGALEKLRSLYANHGLLTTEIKPDYQFDSARRVVNPEVTVNEKERIYVGRIRLEMPPLEGDQGWIRRWWGRFSPPAKEQTVLREVLLKPGEIYNRQLERDTERRLARLGVFEDQSLKVTNAPTAEPGVHDVVIHGTPAATGALSGGIGYGDAIGAYVFASLSERNVFGEANVFNIQTTLGTKDVSVTASYLDRHLGDTDNSLMTRLYWETLGRPGYDAHIIGASSELGHPLTNNWTMFTGGRLEAVRLEGDNDYDDADEDLDRSYGVLTGRLRFEQDTRYPYGFRPREGYLQSLGTEMGYAGGALVKLEAARDQYLPLSERLTYRMAASAGMMPFDADTVPIHERYFLGGNNDMRGFRYRGAGYFDDEEDNLPIGGAAKLLVKNELQFPIIDPITGVGFVDVGTLGKSPVSWQVPRVSTGAGLRFDLRRVQVAVDLAAPVVKQDNDETRFFHFSLQSRF